MDQTHVGATVPFPPTAAAGRYEQRRAGSRTPSVIPEREAKDGDQGSRIRVPGEEARRSHRRVQDHKSGHGSNNVYKRLRERGYEVFAVNPNADKAEGDLCYRDLRAIPGGVDAVVIGTRPERAEDTMHECADLGIKHVWMHRGPGAGSVSPAATEYGRRHGITVIDGGCPCMFEPTADFGHKVMRIVYAGHVPKRV